MVKSTDVKGRLALFRYGLVVVVVITFIVSVAVPFVFLQPYLNELQAVDDQVAVPGIAEVLPVSLIATVIVAVLALAAYFAYAQFLKRTVSDDEASQAQS